MTLKLIDLFETKFIGEQNIEYIELFKNIEVHPILNIIPEIRKQFILLVSIYHNNLFVIFFPLYLLCRQCHKYSCLVNQKQLAFEEFLH